MTAIVPEAPSASAGLARWIPAIDWLPCRRRRWRPWSSRRSSSSWTSAPWPTCIGLYTQRLGRIYGVAARADFISAVAAMVGVLVFDTLPGLVIGVFVSILLLLYRTSRPNVATLGRLPGTSGPYVDLDRDPDAHEVPGIVIVRPESGLFFVNAEHIRAQIRRRAAAPGTRGVILDLQTVPDVDVTAMGMVEELIGELTRSGIRVVLARNIGQVRDRVRGGGEHLPEIYPSVAEAVATIGEDPRAPSGPRR